MFYVCQRKSWFRVIFVIAVTFLLVAIISFTVIDQESATFVINVMNVIGLTLFALGSGFVVRYCTQKDEYW